MTEKDGKNLSFYQLLGALTHMWAVEGTQGGNKQGHGKQVFNSDHRYEGAGKRNRDNRAYRSGGQILGWWVWHGHLWMEGCEL